MVYTFTFPDVGEGIHEGEVVKWLVKEGDTVTADQIIAEVQTDKAIVEIPAPKSGTLLKRSVREGQKIKVGDVLCLIGEQGEKITERKVPAEPEKKSIPEKSQAQKHVSPQPLFSSEDQMKPVLLYASTGLSIIATPRTRQLARSLGIDITRVSGTGPGNRITEQDVQHAAKGISNASSNAVQIPTIGTPEKTANEKKTATVTFEKWGSVLRIPLKGIRKATAEHMAQSWATIPHVTHMDEADVTDLSARREREKGEAEKRGFKLTYLPFITKAVIGALHLYPYFNASLAGEDGEEIVVKKYYNIGIAVDTSNGLMVPNVKNAEKMSILEIAREMQTLAEKCRDRTISLEEMQGGTFTITNVGSFGGIMATPIIHYPEVAILGIGALREKPIVYKGKITIRKMLPLFLSFDHRVVDGAAAAKFMNEIMRHLEDPDLLLVDVV